MPLGGGQMKEPVTATDIRRWVQGMAEPAAAVLQRGVRGGESLRQARRAAVVRGLHQRQPRRRSRDPGQHPRHAHALRRRRVVVRRSAHRAGRRDHARTHALRLQGHRDEVRRPDDVLARRHHLPEAERPGRLQAALDVDPLPRRRGAPARRLRRDAGAALDRRGDRRRSSSRSTTTTGPSSISVTAGAAASRSARSCRRGRSARTRSRPSPANGARS